MFILAAIAFFMYDVPGMIKEYFSSSKSSNVASKTQNDFAAIMGRRKNSRRRKSRKNNRQV